MHERQHFKFNSLCYGETVKFAERRLHASMVPTVYTQDSSEDIFLLMSPCVGNVHIYVTAGVGVWDVRFRMLLSWQPFIDVAPAKAQVSIAVVLFLCVLRKTPEGHSMSEQRVFYDDHWPLWFVCNLAGLQTFTKLSNLQIFCCVGQMVFEIWPWQMHI